MAIPGAGSSAGCREWAGQKARHQMPQPTRRVSVRNMFGMNTAADETIYTLKPYDIAAPVTTTPNPTLTMASCGSRLRSAMSTPHRTRFMIAAPKLSSSLVLLNQEPSIQALGPLGNMGNSRNGNTNATTTITPRMRATDARFGPEVARYMSPITKRNRRRSTMTSLVQYRRAYHFTASLE